jgi:cellulose synthase/poly-beta-1,6-N-acetylglucosamine synthase-like glycosyltransferase
MTTPGLVLLAGAIAVPAYAFVVYPLLLRLLAVRRPAGAVPPAAEPLPTITITVPAYNEERQIRPLIESLLAIDYPAELRQILIVSDASSDGTDAIVREYADRGVELLRLPERTGKTGAENFARPHVRGDIVINTDASVRVHPAAVRALVDALGDPGVGVASGRDVSIARAGDDANSGESGYVGYEMRIRAMETRVGGIVGASGCLYAIRRDLHMQALPDAYSRDFGAALVAREHGFRSVSVSDAVCYVPRAPSLRHEYRRKVRTITRGMQTLLYKRHLLDPIRYGVFAWMLFSHKVVRWLTPVAAVAAAAALVLLAFEHAWARGLLVAGLAALGAGGLGWLWPEGRPMPRLIAVPTYVAASNLATLHAWARALTGRGDPVWEPTRRETIDAVPAAAPGAGIGGLGG